MAEMDLVKLFSTIPSLIEQLSNAFLELESHYGASVDETQLKQIVEHFQNLETVMTKKHSELEVREKSFKEEESDMLKLITLREADVTNKEQELFDRIQDLKDAAVSLIAEARANHQLTSMEHMDVVDSKDSQVSSSLDDTNPLNSGPKVKSPNKSDDNLGDESGEVDVPIELMKLCEQMDARGLLCFIAENQKDLPSIDEKLSHALESATEPVRLVLASLEGNFPSNDISQEFEKNNAAVPGMLHSCLVCLKALATLLAKAGPGAENLLNLEIKQHAMAIANEWKPKVASAGGDAANGNSLETEAFLQLLATFRISSQFNEEELCKLVLAVSHLRHVPELCRSLGLAHKIPGLVETLISQGKRVNAVHFIHTFHLSESFPPAPLLKEYLKEIRRNSQGKGSSSGNAGGAEGDGNTRELAALKAVIECVQDYKLEANYPLDSLLTRVEQLEKSRRNDKKRPPESSKRQQQFKKPRANGSVPGYRLPAPYASRPAPRASYAGMSERYPPRGPSLYDYQAPSQPTYPQQSYDHRSYYYPQDVNVTPDPSTTAAAASSYGSYYAGTGMQSSQQPYM